MLVNGDVIGLWHQALSTVFGKSKSSIENAPKVTEIMPTTLRACLADFEKGRIRYQFHEAPLRAGDLINWAASLPGPRIVILNTVQSAAVVAREYARRFGRLSVEHLSTALTPCDRDATLDRIKAGLADANDADWTLIATSCVEAGVDLSFKTGVREAASLVSSAANRREG